MMRGETLRLAGILLMLAGCATERVSLRHPETGATLTCGPYAYNPLIGPDVEAAQAQQNVCVNIYFRQGYERVAIEAEGGKAP